MKYDVRGHRRLTKLTNERFVCDKSAVANTSTNNTHANVSGREAKRHHRMSVDMFH
jgi:hypothetical protein